jgi:hypothetical protein
MKKELFDELLESVKEGGAILRGERAPSRVFHHPPQDSQAELQRAFAVCVETDDPELLIPRKIYEVTLLPSSRVHVIDEAGEAAIYPAENFILIDLPREVEEALSRVA